MKWAVLMFVVATTFRYGESINDLFKIVARFEKAGNYRCQGNVMGEVPVTSYADCAVFCHESGTVV